MTKSFAWGRAAVALGAGAGATIVALALGPAPLFVLGVGLLLVGAAAPAWTWLSGTGASVRRELPTARVVEGQPLEATLTLRGGWLGLPTGEVHDPLVRERVRIPRGRRARIKMVARFERRGLRTLPPPALVVRDPVELTRILVVSPQPGQELLVLPRTEPVRSVSRGGARTIGLLGRTSDILAAVEVDGLREYQPGTPASRIHWPALARGAGLLERKLRVAGDTVPLVVFDGRGPEPVGVHADHLDAAVRAAASLTLELARAWGCRLLLPGERRALEISPDLLAWPPAHARLAVIQGGPGTRAPSPGAIQGALGPLFYVTAAPHERPPAALRPGHGRPVVLVVPEPLASPSLGSAAFTVAGCAGLRIETSLAARSAGRPRAMTLSGSARW
ncbi:MAG: DUF58 domain-containing protein [Solirubrobacteraceae bacterium]